jgi:hypothetical protein
MVEASGLRGHSNPVSVMKLNSDTADPEGLSTSQLASYCSGCGLSLAELAILHPDPPIKSLKRCTICRLTHYCSTVSNPSPGPPQILTNQVGMSTRGLAITQARVCSSQGTKNRLRAFQSRCGPGSGQEVDHVRDDAVSRKTVLEEAVWQARRRGRGLGERRPFCCAHFSDWQWKAVSDMQSGKFA